MHEKKASDAPDDDAILGEILGNINV